MVIMYLADANFTCPKEKIMHTELSLALTLLITFTNSMKQDINSFENSVDPDHATWHCELIIIN